MSTTIRRADPLCAFAAGIVIALYFAAAFTGNDVVLYVWIASTLGYLALCHVRRKRAETETETKREGAGT